MPRIGMFNEYIELSGFSGLFKVVEAGPPDNINAFGENFSIFFF